MTVEAKKLSFMKRLMNNPFFSCLKKRKTTVIYVLFVVAALVQGVFYAVKLPFGQVPDEIAHYQMMEEEFGTTGYIDELISGFYYPARLHAIPRNYNAKVNVDAYEAAAYNMFSRPITLSSFHPRYTIVRHLPCGIGFYLGIAMDLPMSWCAGLAEIFSVLFFVGVGYATLKTAPVKKDIFAFCMLIPQTLHMCASVNYDAVLLPVSFFLFAYVLKLFYSDRKVRWRNIWVVALLSLVLLIVKPPYVLIALTMLIIPHQQYDLKIGCRFELARFIHRFRYVIILVLFVLFAAGLYMFRNNSFVKVVLSDVLCFPQFLTLLKKTFLVQGNLRVIQTVGMFGWHDSQVSTMFIIVFFMMLTYLNTASSEPEVGRLSFSRRLWLVFVFVAAFFLIELVFQRWTYDYLGWNLDVGLSEYKAYIPELTAIMGVQGRYWIPVLPVLLVGLCGQAERKHKKLYWPLQIAYYAFAFYSVMNVLDLRYWIK